jgi:GTP-binding protein Era
VFLLINKIDTIDKTKLLSIMDSYSKQMNFAEIIPISALKADNKELLLKAIEKYLPVGPKYFPEDMITDQPERQIVAEIIREKALYLLQDEIPHGIAVEVTGMKRRSDKEITDIDATIYCERESHKGIIIGKKGSMLKKIGSTARYDIEKFIGGKANVQLWIKVKKDWRDSDNLLKAFGYDAKKI